MIHVNITRKDDSYELSVTGHAGYGQAGKDIVCASASTLAYTLLGFLENCPTVEDLDTIERSGEMEIACKGSGKYIKTAFTMTAIGFLQLEKAYPQNVRVDCRGF